MLDRESLRSSVRAVISLIQHLFQATFFCWKSKTETPEQRVKSVKVNIQNIRTTSMMSFWFLYCWHITDFTHCSGVSIVDVEQANVAGFIFNFSQTYYWFMCLLLAFANMSGSFLVVFAATFNEVLLPANNMFGVTDLVVREVLRLWSSHTSSRLLLV